MSRGSRFGSSFTPGSVTPVTESTVCRAYISAPAPKIGTIVKIAQPNAAPRLASLPRRRSTKPRITSAAEAATSKVLAANQGLYNGFLAAGLAWGLSLGAAGAGVKVFFLACVVVAGVYGAATVGKKILFVQALPAALALALLFAAS